MISQQTLAGPKANLFSAAIEKIFPISGEYSVSLSSPRMDEMHLRSILIRTKCRTLEELGKLVGAPHNSIVSISDYLDKDSQSGSIHVSYKWGKATHQAASADDVPIYQIMGSVSIYQRTAKGENYSYLTLNRLHFESKEPEFPDLRAKGIGTKLVVGMLQAASFRGYRFVNTFGLAYEAKDYWDQPGSSERNGYYTFPRLGFNAPLDFLINIEAVRQLLSKNPELLKRYPQGFFEQRVPHRGNGEWQKDLDFNLEECPSLSDLIQSSEGRKWWKDHGSNIHLRFDLREDSKSWRTLDAYLTSKRENLSHHKGGIGNEAPRNRPSKRGKR